MIVSGLVSITFRELTVNEIVDLVSRAELGGIEWGSDVHVPAGDLKIARSVRALMSEKGLETYAYGSYYRTGENRDPATDFLPYLISAVALGAPSIRVWAGKQGSLIADEAYRQAVALDARIICDLAAAEGIDIAYEYHPNTLTDERHSALNLFLAVDRPNLKLNWQPNFALEKEENLAALRMVSPYLRDVHVFTWFPDHSRRALAEGRELWMEYLDIIRSDGQQHKLMLEFVKDNSSAQLLADASSLNDWLADL